MSKDLFSNQAAYYAQYRPGYPKELVEYISGLVAENENAWDCATGNGQVAILLADYFKKVEATDISENQLSKAVKNERIHYSIASAEKTFFPDDYFDLITMAQAYHWIQPEAFHQEVKRVARNGAVVAIWGYNLMQTGVPGIDRMVHSFYYDIVGPYWDPERKHVENNYQDLPFDFELLPLKPFEMKVNWNEKALPGYMRSWSAVQNFMKANGYDPVERIEDQLKENWQPGKIRAVQFPLFMKLGRVVK